MKKKKALPNKTQLKAYTELRRIGASPASADRFIKKHRIGVRKRRR